MTVEQRAVQTSVHLSTSTQLGVGFVKWRHDRIQKSAVIFCVASGVAVPVMERWWPLCFFDPISKNHEGCFLKVIMEHPLEQENTVEWRSITSVDVRHGPFGMEGSLSVSCSGKRFHPAAYRSLLELDTLIVRVS